MIMNSSLTSKFSAARRTQSVEVPTRRPHFRLGLLLAAASLATTSHAIDFGPDGMFSLNGFGEVTMSLNSNYCADCQWVAGQEKDKNWSDPVIPGREYKTRGVTFSQFQPYLGAKIDLGKGYKLSGLVSQRWRDGMVDVPQAGSVWNGFWYDKNIAISHEDYGSVRAGHMTTRAWSVSDYPYGTNVGLSGPWSASGAGYGMLTSAVRYTSRILDVAEGDLVLEATYDMGNTEFKINKPRFLEFYAQFHRGDLVVDAMLQDARNGTPSAWTHGPFTGLTPFPMDDSLLSESSQGIAMVMGRYQYNSQIEISAGLRRNWWSGANAVFTTNPSNWNNMFNVDWGGTLNGVTNPGYPASSIDVMLGGRYRVGKWVTSLGLIQLGTARTDNPSERGQGNSALVGALGLQYDYGNGLKFNIQTGAVHYARLGLSPMSLASNASINDADSRITQDSNWVTVGFVYGF